MRKMDGKASNGRGLTNPVILLLQVTSCNFEHMYLLYIVSDLWKAAKLAKVNKES